MNQVSLVGKLQDDIDVRYAKEIPIANFRVASGVKVGERWENWYANCVAFGKVAQRLAAIGAVKGTHVIVYGRMKTDSWTDKEGKKRYKDVLNVFSFGIVPEDNQGQDSVPEQTEIGPF